MKRHHFALIAASILLLGAWKLTRSNPFTDSKTDQANNSVSAQKNRPPKSSRHANLLARVMVVAKRRLPDVDFKQRESVVFSQVNAKIDELEVMELLLAVEEEFAISIPEKSIIQLVGVSNRRDLLNHLSLDLVAELVDEVDPSAGR